VIGLDLFRGLRPGAHRLELRVLDRNGQTLLHLTRDVEVPRLETPPPPLAGRRRDYGQLTREEVVLLDTFPSVEILPLAAPAGGRTDLVAITTGGPIAAVAFYVDDQLAGVDETAPFGARLVLSEGSHRIRAVARDTQAHPLAEDEREVDLARRPFRVRLSRPEGASRALRARVTLPEGSQLARLECFDGREPVATLTEAPFECPLPARAVGGLRYVRATATLVDGETAEDLLFFGPRTPENVDVQLVQLLVSVFDGSGRPVGGLGAADFRIWEEGRQLDLVRLESLADLPISVAVLMDLSSSMGRLAGLAAESAQRFFERVLTETDLASLLAFNDGFHQLVPFTGDIDELRLGAEGVRALGSTRLHDGIVWALGQYAGQRNRRALVILSDGADVGSDYPLEQVVQAAVDAGVAIYPVSLVRPGERSPESLDPLAARTGGTRYVVGSIEELDRAFRLIAHELRSQYLLVYSVAEGEEDGTAPGAVDIEVLRSGLTTRNVRSYPP
jgi:VWFA-related protein